jgi:hypothetical protein
MDRFLSFAALAASTALLAAAVSLPSADDDCRLQISGSPNGTVRFLCPDVTCNDGSDCQIEDCVIVGTFPDQERQHYCRCGAYSPNQPCMGFGYIHVSTAVWRYECRRNGCSIPCAEFAWPPVATPKTVCEC